jgi:hypothetical protein
MTVSERVAVMIPAYNAEGTIGETLASVRRQSHADLEIVVEDGGSTDGTAEVAEFHEAEDRRIRLLRIANGGVAAARNAGIGATSAPFAPRSMPTISGISRRSPGRSRRRSSKACMHGRQEADAVLDRERPAQCGRCLRARGAARHPIASCNARKLVLVPSSSS